MVGMLPPNDYIRAARYLIERNGHKALTRAEARAEALLIEGEQRSHALWKVLAATIAEMAGAGRKPEPTGNFFNHSSSRG